MTTIANPNTIPTADEYREMARDCAQRKAESWERSDTDGFLSQWAMDQMQHRYLANAQIVEKGGVNAVVVVEIATGKVVATEDDVREGQYGHYYLIPADVAVRTTRFFTPSKARNEATADANNAKKGLRVEVVFVPLANCWEDRRTGRIEVFDYDALKD